MRVLITDFLAELDFEREVVPGVEVDALVLATWDIRSGN